MTTPFLSIVIPSRNRASFLANCIDSALGQGLPDGTFEIVVCDNDSTDDTGLVIAALRGRGAPIVYHRQSSNVGFDRNFACAMGLARGRYTWAIGDDDWFEPRGITRALDVLAAHPNATGLTVECNGYGVDGRPLDVHDGTGSVRAFTPAKRAVLDPLVAHRLANMSLHVFDTARAMECAGERPLPSNGCSAHALLLRTIARGTSWIHADIRAAAWRYGNDGFMENGLLARARLALHAYPDNIREAFGPRSDEVELFMTGVLPRLARNYVLMSSNVPRYVRHMRTYHCAPSERRQITLEIVRTLGTRRAFWTQVLPVVAIPTHMLAAYARGRDLFDNWRSAT